MAIMVSEGQGGDFKPVPEGTHSAVCDMVVDLGIQKPNNPEWKRQRKAYIRWQIPAHRVEYTDAGGNEKEGPMVVGRLFTLSLHEKSSLRAALENWRGRKFTADELREFDVTNILTAPCLIQVQHNHKGERTYSNVTGIMAIPNGTPRPQLDGEGVVYDGDPEVLERLPKFLREMIAKQCDSYDAEPGEPAPGTNNGDNSIPDDETPF